MQEREKKIESPQKFRKPAKKESIPKDNGTMARLRKRRMRRPIPRN